MSTNTEFERTTVRNVRPDDTLLINGDEFTVVAIYSNGRGYRLWLKDEEGNTRSVLATHRESVIRVRVRARKGAKK